MTATWQFSIWLVAPQCCGATPTDLSPFLTIWVSSDDQHPVRIAEVFHHVVTDLPRLRPREQAPRPGPLESNAGADARNTFRAEFFGNLYGDDVWKAGATNIWEKRYADRRDGVRMSILGSG
jgi:hypothetical protein